MRHRTAARLAAQTQDWQQLAHRAAMARDELQHQLAAEHEAGATVRELAAAIGIPAATVHRWIVAELRYQIRAAAKVDI